ncbi:MAG TPA: crotonase/enoyl-CoA hydratase family protein [Acidimicrobiales bacterium]|jgi:enoyl-CoA hydratase|nr:crotonase/enoyl-CoA hydratase family protein [Acidimicrobiales bacterium]
MATSEVLTLARHGHVATLWLDNPDRGNAMGPAFWADLPRCMAEVGDDDDVRAVVVAARGAHFSVGLDLKSAAVLVDGEGGGATSGAARAARTYREVRRLQASINAVAECPKPVVAAIQGYCIGGGVDLACACDIRLAASGAVFSVRETRMAIVADLGSLQRLPRVIPQGHAAELAYTGRDIDAERARAIGLVNDVLADHDAVVAAAGDLAGEIASNSPLAVQGTKAVLAASQDRTVAEGLDFVAAWNAGFLASEDLAEAMAAFREKRPPDFRGR